MKKELLMFIPLYFFSFCFLNSIKAQKDCWYYNINDKRIAIDSYDVVAYHTLGQAVLGKKQFKVIYQKNTYLFSNQQHRKLFQQNPEKYLPAYGGWCTFLMGIDKKIYPPTRSKPDPKNFLILQNRLYLFGKNAQQNFKTAFEKSDTAIILRQAIAFWTTREQLASYTNHLPQGMNRNARMELLEWTPFMDNWKCEVDWWIDTIGKQRARFTGKWFFKFGYLGYCIQDDYIGDNDGNFSGTVNGPAIRGYDPVNEKWHMTFIPVNRPRDATWLMQGNFLDKGIIEGTMEVKDPYGNPITQKVRFESKSEQEFIWSAAWSYDNGKTWLKNTGYATCQQLANH